MKKSTTLFTYLALVASLGITPSIVHADTVTDWNIRLGAAQKASGATGSTQSHRGAIVHAAIFDAVNGIAQKYSPYFVEDEAPAGANQDAAAAQAAHTTLSALFPAPALVAAFDTQLAASLGAIAASPQSIAAGRVWGDYVAHQILNWRGTDGFKNVFSYLGTLQPGCWRTPTAGLSAVNVQFATMEPFTMDKPYQFRPQPPYGSVDRPTALTSAVYAADLNEVKAVGSATSSVRTQTQTNIALFWQAVDNADQNAAIRSLVPAEYELVDTARLFALCSLATCDAAIAVYDAKYAFGFWRPIDAIRLADTDNNPATDPDLTWSPLVATPRHPEYPSAHTMISGAMLGTAALILGDEHSFSLSTPGFPSLTQPYTRLTDAVNEVLEARIWIGFHFRTACEEGRDTGFEIASNAVRNLMRPRSRGWYNRHGVWQGDPHLRN